MPDTETTATTTDGSDQNTATQANSGAGTDTAQPNQATQSQERTFTQAEVDAMISQRLPRAVKAELKKMSSDGDDQKPNADELQRQLSDKDAKIRSYEARETVESFLNDGRNKLNIRPENVRGIQALVIPLLEYGDDGRPSNLKEAIESAKAIAPVLFTNHQSNINANNGTQSVPASGNMNDFIRRSAGYGN
jgi:hypothetical protein